MKISRNNIYNQFIPNISPCVRIPSGTRLKVETQDALFGRGREISAGRYSPEYLRTKANPVTGPIYVEGAKPEDSIEVVIHSITLVGNGYFNVPVFNGTTEITSKNKTFIEAMVLGDSLRMNGNTLPSAPMIGVIGTAAASDLTPWYSTETGDHGGNMDSSIIHAGVTVYLPVFTEGALLGLGDVHAVMGDGEVYGQGVEISAEIDITVKCRRDLQLKRPLVESSSFFATIASADTMEMASEICIRDMNVFLQKYCGLTPVNAGIAIACYGNLAVCQLCNEQKTMRMEIEKDAVNLFGGNVHLSRNL